MIEPLLTVKEVAAILNTSAKTVYRLVKRGCLRAKRVGHELRFEESDVRAYLDGGDAQVVPTLRVVKPDPIPPDIARLERLAKDQGLR